MKTYLKMLPVLLLFLNSCKDAKKGEEAEALKTDAETTTAVETQSEVQINPVEHATAVIQWGETTIYIDPIGGAKAFADYPKPDLILVTDMHGDHFNAETIEGLDTSDAKIMVPQAVADLMPEQFATQIDVLNNGDSKERFDILVEAIPMYNLREEAKDFHVKGRGNGYVLNIGDQRIYFSGDTEDIPEMRALEDIDKAFVCMNLPYTMTVDSAADAVLAFKPKQVYPYHFRGRPEVSDVNQFASLVNSGNPDIEVVQLDWYPNEPY